VIWLFVVLAALTTFVIAAVSVGSVTAGLAGRSRRSVYDLEDAVDFVADALPPSVTAEVSFDDVRAVLGWYVEYLADKGIASNRTADDPGSGLIVVGDDERLAFVIGRVDAADNDAPGSQLSDEQVATILDANLRYERSIGAIGPEVPPPTLDTP
jgi:hypothetical protein